jgi:hypothetical protein
MREMPVLHCWRRDELGPNQFFRIELKVNPEAGPFELDGVLVELILLI